MVHMHAHNPYLNRRDKHKRQNKTTCEITKTPNFDGKVFMWEPTAHIKKPIENMSFQGL